MSKPKKDKVKILFYDIETTPLQAWVWRCGKQHIRHGQLVQNEFNQWQIICIAYAWNDNKPAKCLAWDYDTHDYSEVIEKFDKLVQQADITIGKNSDKFDVKHINTQRMLLGQEPMPDWALVTDDLEKQLRRHFVFPSHSLDYVSHLLGYGGKSPVEFQDWINIVENRNKASFNRMIKYCKKDVEDTRSIWNHVEPHVIPKFNYAAYYGDLRCSACGSTNITKNGTRMRGKTKYQRFQCNDHGGYAGMAPISATGKLGKIG